MAQIVHTAPMNFRDNNFQWDKGKWSGIAFMLILMRSLKVGVYIPLHLVSDVSHDVGMQVIT